MSAAVAAGVSLPHRLSGAIRRRPVAVLIVGAMIGLGAARLVVPGAGHAWRITAAGLVDGSAWSRLLLAPFTAAPLGGWIVAVVAAAVALAFAEPRLGSRRTALVWAVGGVVGALVGLVSALVGAMLQADGALEVRSEAFADVTPALLAVVVAVGMRDRSGRMSWVPAAAAIVVGAVLLYSGDPRDIGRLAGVAVGVIAGMAAGGRFARSPRPSGRHALARRVLALATVGVAVGPLIVFFGPRHPGVLSLLGGALVAQPTWTAGTLASGLGVLNVAVMVLMLVAAHGLLVGTRAGALLAIAVHVVVGSVGVGGYIVPAIAEHWFAWRSLGDVEFDGALLAVAVVPLGLAAVIALRLRDFEVRAAPGIGIRSFAAIGGAIVVSVSAYALIAAAAGAQPDEILAGVNSRFLPPGVLNVLGLEPVTLDATVRVVGRWCGLALWAAVVVVAHRAVLSVVPAGEDAAAAAGMRSRLRLYGGGTLGHMATWPGWRIWLDDAGATAIAYRTVGRVALALGQPVGPAADEAGAIARFSRWCEDRGWSPAFYSAPSRLQPVFDELRWRTVSVGSEATVRLPGFSLSGKRKQNVRTAVNRAEREGIEARWLAPSELSPHLWAEVRRVSEAWTASRALPEMGFTLGGVDQLHDPEVRLMLAVDSDERVHAVTSWLPIWEGNALVGYTLDVMRRGGEAMPGVIEFLIAQTAFRARDAGLDRISLSVSPLESSVTTRRVDRWISRLGRLVEPLYGFRSLAAFKGRFDPVYEPVLLAFPGEGAMPVTMTAVVRSYLPDVSIGAALWASRGVLRQLARA
ncbi:bifunctional lysylphosphatidylglycerol flippase/synthetase MprF [Pseudolysinimonas sp.]|uniref:bifunctional lysylphosphatidylglycerol flippase/synthetase MprF n=1 Tax=Pseudolysinimonas sp. TaxID=2680009 RepID=UPI003F7D52A8